MADSAFALSFVLQTHCHAMQVCHGDLKLENLLLHPGPDNQAVLKLIDFGLSRSMAEVSDGGSASSTTSSQPGPEQALTTGTLYTMVGGNGHTTSAAGWWWQACCTTAICVAVCHVRRSVCSQPSLLWPPWCWLPCSQAPEVLLRHGQCLHHLSPSLTSSL